MRLTGRTRARALLHWALVLGALAWSFLASDAALAGRRVALVIGNSAYRNAGPLPNTLSDARAIADLLKNAGFNLVELRTDLGVVEFKRVLRGFVGEASDADMAVVYFAGHGIMAGNTNYLIPTDAKLATDYDAEDEAVSLDRIISALQGARQLRLIILDACRENPFVHKMQRTVSLRGIAPGLATIDPVNMGADTVIAYAAKAGSFSYDGEGRNSPFATALLKYIAEPGLDIRIALGKVHDEVLRLTGNMQEPVSFYSLGGKTISLVPAAEPEKSAPLPPVLDAKDVARDYELAERVGTQQAWESFLATHKTGFYADLARAQLAKQRQAMLAPPKDRDPADPAKRLDEARLAQPPIDRRPPEPAPRLDVPPKPDAEPLSHAEICKRDTDRLNRLRANPVRENVERFGRDLACEELRPQFARLLESVGPVQSEPPRIAVLQDKADRTAREITPPDRHDPAVELPGDPRTTINLSPDETCRHDKAKLAKLRADPVRDEVARFARELHCEALRPQVTRLLESVGN